MYLAHLWWNYSSLCSITIIRPKSQFQQREPFALSLALMFTFSFVKIFLNLTHVTFTRLMFGLTGCQSLSYFSRIFECIYLLQVVVSLTVKFVLATTILYTLSIFFSFPSLSTFSTSLRFLMGLSYISLARTTFSDSF
jgi:hypothetical protein